MARIQAGGWTDEEDLFGPPERAPAVGKGKKDKGKGKRKGKDKKKAATGRADATEDEAEADDGEEDEVTPVVVKEKEMRQTLVLYLEGFTAATYFAEGIAQSTPSLLSSLSLISPLTPLIQTRSRHHPRHLRLHPLPPPLLQHNTLHRRRPRGVHHLWLGNGVRGEAQR